jgi:hypothetical protein
MLIAARGFIVRVDHSIWSLAVGIVRRNPGTDGVHIRDVPEDGAEKGV